jgi:hypothetical protein
MGRYELRMKAQKEFAYYATKYIQEVYETLSFLQNILN